MLRQALDTATPTLRDIAKAAGVGYHAVRQYRLGARTPDPTAVRALAAALDRQARTLKRLADQLVNTAPKGGKTR
jgi:transcriptional regulator with XRE-family HTH domain